LSQEVSRITLLLVTEWEEFAGLDLGRNFDHYSQSRERPESGRHPQISQAPA
jgi:hypothetical protein